MVTWADAQAIILNVFRFAFTILIVLSILLNVLIGLIVLLFVPLDITLVEFCQAVSQTLAHRSEGEL